MSETLSSTLIVGIMLLLAGLVGYAVFYIRKWIVQRIGQDTYDHINKIIEDIVRSVEQIGYNVGWSGEDKKTMAVNLIRAALEKLGYQVDYELIDRLVERAVQILNENTIRFPAEELDET